MLYGFIQTSGRSSARITLIEFRVAARVGLVGQPTRPCDSFRAGKTIITTFRGMLTQSLPWLRNIQKLFQSGRHADQTQHSYQSSGTVLIAANRSIFEHAGISAVICPSFESVVNPVRLLTSKERYMRQILRLVVVALLMTCAGSTASLADSPIPTCSPGHCK